MSKIDAYILASSHISACCADIKAAIYDAISEYKAIAIETGACVAHATEVVRNAELYVARLDSMIFDSTNNLNIPVSKAVADRAGAVTLDVLRDEMQLLLSADEDAAEARYEIMLQEDLLR